MNLTNWTYQTFNELDARALYSILQLRCKVFIVEQNCPYLDPDGKDPASYHLCGFNNDQLVAYARILPPGLSYVEASIGRVVTDPAHRRSGAGKELMQLAIGKTYSTFDIDRVKIGAQLYLKDFYTNLGFRQCSETYLEDGIPHIEMLHTK